MSQKVVWLFGRGLSIGCGLTWDVPETWQELERAKRLEKIREALLAEMEGPTVCTRSIRRFLEFLAHRTTAGWRHLFLTTNWDFLLQREILAVVPDKVKPAWLSSSHVFHLNGTLEDPLDHHFRSPFLLPEDSYSQRVTTTEANRAFSEMIWERTFVLLGMSFECATDRFLLQQLNKVEDHLPIGESKWFIVNPDPDTLSIVCKRIQGALPHSTVLPICRTLNQWREEGFNELISRGISNF